MSLNFRIFAPIFRQYNMENTRISFEIPNTGGFTVKELTERVRNYAMLLVNPREHEPTDEEIATCIGRAFPHRSDEEMAAELDHRWEHYLQHPGTAIPHEKVMDHLMSLL